MSILKNQSINDLESAAGPVEINVMKYARGELTLGGGTGVATQSIPGFPSTAQVLCSTKTAGGTPGIVGGTYNASTGVLTLQSSNAADTSVMNWMLID